MRHLVRIALLALGRQRAALLRGAALALLVLLMGVWLLGLSGWFITCAAVAGLAGAGATFDVFRPSATVRFLALGRTVARYGERLFTHDAVLRSLESLRIGVLGGLLRAPPERMARIRGAEASNRLTADVDALDPLFLRLVIPVAAALAALAATTAALWWLVHPAVAAVVGVGWLAGGSLVLITSGRRTAGPSRRLEAAHQAFRTRLIDLVQSRDDLAVYGLLQRQRDAVLDAEARRAAFRRVLDRADRRAGALLGAWSAIVAGGALWIGLDLARDGRITVPAAALGFFAALALFEAAAPLRRALADYGRMVDSARRLRSAAPDAGEDAPVSAAPPPVPPDGAVLVCEGCAVSRLGGGAPVVRGFDLVVGPGETVALTGPSGSGKSTLLLALAGMHPLLAGRATLAGRPLGDWSETELRGLVGYLPQRSELLTGTVEENLRLARPEAVEEELARVLAAVRLDAVLAPRGGPAFALGPRGAGLSGGERRRLTLARVLLRRPALLLLDEPTEGLDEETAAAVLAGIRTVLPDAAILVAAHRPVEIAAADRAVSVQSRV